MDLEPSLQERVVAAIGDHYELEDEIGRGGMSVVYRARDRRLNRPVAVKVLPPELAYDPAIRARFTREAQTSARLAHAHIVPIYDVGERDGLAYFVMAVVDGGNLATLLAKEPRQPVEEVRRLLGEVSDALAYAHLRGVIHRDIKPDNILLDGDTGRAMVTDFGIARAIEAGTRLTVTGNAIGTPTYMSPEQAMGEREVDGRSDIYSLGVLAYQMLTGRVPFTAANSMALLLKHVSEAPKPIAELRPDTPKALSEVIDRALMKSPEDRWPTAAAMRDALRANEPAGAPWRPEQREPVRYVSPRPVSRRRVAPVAEARPEGIPMEPPHLAALTKEQREDLRLWHGRVNLLDRVKAMRGYTLLTLGATGLGLTGMVLGFTDVPPLVVSPLVPMYMWVKLWKRGGSLRESGLRLRRVLLMPSARRAFPSPPSEPTVKRLEKLAPRDVLDGPHGIAIRRAAQDRSAILDIAGNLPKSDRALIPDLESTVDALVARVAQLAQMLHRLDQSLDPRQAGELDTRIAAMSSESTSPEDERRVALLRRQRATLDELVQRRSALARQLDSAGLALGNLRLDLIKVRSNGLQSSLADVTSATQEVRALSRDIDAMLEAVAEVKAL
ncbi:MAG TPA: protein kinase [Gemmatimonadaceae bacterium]|nr:protein kinase [Gemmatimonadaceae bacterium]